MVRPLLVATKALFLLLFLMPSVAMAGELDDFEAGVRAYQTQEYERTIALFEESLGNTIRSPGLVVEARKYLGASYALSGQSDAAERQFRQLLALAPDTELDPSVFPSSVRLIFREVLEALERQRVVERERQDAETRRQAEQQERRQRHLEELLERVHEDIEVPHLPGLAYIPFGVGQLQNGSEALGVLFATTQAFTLTGAIATLIAWLSAYEQFLLSPSNVQRNLLQGLQIANWSFVGSFAILAVAGLIEANLNYVPSHRVPRENRVPDEIIEDLRLLIGPSGISLTGRF